MVNRLIFFTFFILIGLSGRAQVGFCMDDILVERWASERDTLGFFLDQQGMTLESMVAESNVKAQRECIYQMADGNKDFIVVVPVHKDSISEAVRYAQEKGSKIIAYDRLMNGVTPDFYISFDNYKVGELQAQSLVDSLSSGKIVVINGPERDGNALVFAQGQRKVLQKNETVYVLESLHLKEWSNLEAFSFMLEYLMTATEEVSGVIAANDQIAEGVGDAFETMSIQLPYITGQDGSESALERIKSGEQGMTVYKDGTQLAKVVALICAGEIPSEIIQYSKTTVTNDIGLVQAFLLQPDVVNKHNVAQYEK